VRRPSGADASARLPTLSRRLLGRLLRQPAMLHGLSAASRTALLAVPDPDLFLEVVKYIAENPSADTAEILGRWSGTGDQQALLALLEQSAPLAVTAVQAEFADGVSRYLALRSQADRRRLLAEVRQDPSREKFQAFWSARRSAGAAADEGDAP
jgi:hypothetical protein